MEDADTLPAMKTISQLAAVILLLAMAGFSGGCASYRALQIEPVGKKTEVIVPKFDHAYYYYDRDQTLYFVMRSHTTDKASGKPVEQIATVRVFWRPVGGKTSMNPTSLNATYRYVLMTPDSVGMYEGAGFVRLWGKNGRPKLDARLMDGDLRLTQASVSFVDNLGRAQIRGNFSATYDDAKAMDMLLVAHQEFFARSLLSKPAPASTQPGPSRDDDFLVPEPPAVVTPPTSAPASGSATQP
jgi:hypothetical protein